MLTPTPATALFSTTLISGTLIALSANDWFTMWSGLELNLLSFLPLMSTTMSQQETEASTKYFLAQATGSICLLLGGMLIISAYPNPTTIFSPMVILAFLLKAGFAPLHFWYPSVMEGLSWPLCLILSTWQKLTPIVALIFLIAPTNQSSLILPTVASAITGATLGLNQSLLRPLISYSSINHMAWMLAASLVSPTGALMYLTTYFISSAALILSINAMKLQSPMDLTALVASPHSLKIPTTLILLSHAGLPPLLGFVPKWLVIQLLLPHHLLIVLILIFSSILTLYFYLTVIFTAILSTAHTPHKPHQTGPKPLLSSIACLLLNMVTLITILKCALTLIYKP